MTDTDLIASLRKIADDLRGIGLPDMGRVVEDGADRIETLGKAATEPRKEPAKKAESLYEDAMRRADYDLARHLKEKMAQQMKDELRKALYGDPYGNPYRPKY